MRRFFLVLLAGFGMYGCSVYMAANSEGVNPLELQKSISRCDNRNCILLLGPKVISSVKNSDETISEEYRFQIDTGAISRSVMHGLLDVATIGLWEIAGTPIEAKRKNTSIIFLKVTYDKNEKILRTDIR